MSAILRIARAGDEAPHGWLEPAGPQPAVEFQGWLELMAAVERLRSAPRKDT